MLPILFKLEFTSPPMQVVLALLILASIGYSVWAGWRGAANRAQAPYRAIPFGLTAVLAGMVAASYAAPPFSTQFAELAQISVWTIAALLIIFAAIYGRKVAPKGEAASKIFSFGIMAAVAGLLAIKFGFSDGVIGRSLGAPLHTYGLLMATAFALAIGLAAREAPRAFPESIKIGGKLVPYGPIVRNHVLDLGFYLLVAALAGSKVLFLITTASQYHSVGEMILALFSLTGGLVFYGGFIGAFLMSLWYCHHYKLPFLRIADIFIPSLAIGHAIGRLGCLSAGCCWGGIARAGSQIALRFPSAKHLPFGGFGADSLAYADQARDNRWADALGHLHDHSVAGAQKISTYVQSTGYSMPVYPTQLMESFGELMFFLFLVGLRRNKRFHGQILATWLICYAFLRFVVELFRGDDIRNFIFKYPNEIHPLFLSTSQTISLGLFLIGAVVYLVYGRKSNGANSLETAPTA